MAVVAFLVKKRNGREVEELGYEVERPAGAVVNFMEVLKKADASSDGGNSDLSGADPDVFLPE